MARPGKPARSFACLSAAALVACAAGSAAAAAGDQPRPHGDASTLYVPGEAIVRYEPSTSATERRTARRAAAVEHDASLELPRTEVVEVDGSVKAAVRRMERQPGVVYAQPNYRYEALAVEPPDDTFFDQLWGLEDPPLPNPGVYVLEAWEETKGDGQIIAIADTGVDLTHPDLQGNLWSNPGQGSSGDGDGNGRIGDVHGFDFVDDDGDPDDYEFHGTHVAGTAAAIADNAQGIAGVAPEAEIMAVRVLDGDGGGSTAGIADGIVYAAEEGADVINLSLGGPAGADAAMEDAIELANVEEAVVVAAAGNEGADNDVEPHTPCALPQANLICVAALNQSGALAGFSNYGASTVDLAAPGTSTLSSKADYGPPLISEDFAAGFGSTWDTAATAGGVEWGLTSLSGNQLATDSPGVGQDYAADAISALFTSADVDLTGERGCRVHFRTMYEIEEFFDAFEAGAFSESSGSDYRAFDGTSSGYPSSLAREEASISNLDGLSDVHPNFRVNADELEELDGAYVDDVRLICRDETYVDEIALGASYDLPDAGNYVRFNGTSMATPHVAGVVALVLAAEPALSAVEVVNAVLEGVSAIPSPDSARRTATEGIADACQAIAVATGADVATECPDSSENVLPPPQIPVVPDTANPNPFEEPEEPSADRTRPRTFFRQRPPHVVRTRRRTARAVFRLGADEDATFVCRIDGAPFHPCGTRLVRRFGIGRHVLQAIARDAAGNVDPTPAVYRFRVKRVG